MLNCGYLQNFNFINRTSLNGNNIKEVAANTFKDVKIRDLSLIDCALVEIEAKAFNGLESYLQRLDLSYNNLTSLPDNLFDKFDHLTTLLLHENALTFDPEKVLGDFRSTIQTLNFAGEKMGSIPVKRINNIRNLRSLGLSSTGDRVSANDFEGFGAALEHLSLSKNKLKTISANAFHHVPGLKSLDLSENRISKIEPDTFLDVAASLTSLNMANGQAITTLPSEPFKKLTSVRSVDFSNNRIGKVPADFFHSMKELRSINLQDNSIGQIPQHMFDAEHTPHLTSLSLSFNFIESVEAQSFVDLASLKKLDLEDNKITTIKKSKKEINLSYYL